MISIHLVNIKKILKKKNKHGGLKIIRNNKNTAFNSVTGK